MMRNKIINQSNNILHYKIEIPAPPASKLLIKIIKIV
jgi:hypothetical protein